MMVAMLLNASASFCSSNAKLVAVESPSNHPKFIRIINVDNVSSDSNSSTPRHRRNNITWGALFIYTVSVYIAYGIGQIDAESKQRKLYEMDKSKGTIALGQADSMVPEE